MVRPCSNPASDGSWRGHRRQGARHVPEIQFRNRRGRHRYRQSAWCDPCCGKSGRVARSRRDHLSRKLQALGHQARLMPAKYVRPRCSVLDPAIPCADYTGARDPSRRGQLEEHVAASGRGRPPATSIFVGRALRARVSDRVQHVSDCDSRCLRRDPGRRILAGDFEGAVAGVRVGAILQPAVLLAGGGSRTSSPLRPGLSFRYTQAKRTLIDFGSRAACLRRHIGMTA
jgi:hypothetical protein